MNSKYSLLVIICGLLVLGLSSCGSSQSVTPVKQAVNPQKVDSVVAAQNRFAFKLFKQVEQSKSAQNTLISPLSIFMNLSMVYNGADGATRAAIKKTLQLQGISDELLNTVNAYQLQNMPAIDPAVQLDIANAIWFNQAVELRSDFATLNKHFYNAKLKAADFGNSMTTEAINHWVAKKTNHKIDKIIEEVKPRDLMYVLNAVYFNGKWNLPFAPKATREQSFFTLHKGEQKRQFMYQNEKFNYLKTANTQIIELPYGDKHYSMYVFLPAMHSSVSALLSQLTADEFARDLQRLQQQEVNLYLPRWEEEYTLANLKDELSKLGMEEAFSGSANFDRLFKEEEAQISEIKHKTFIRVDEEGTEAAAVTSTGIRATAMPLNPPATMVVNRPFVYAIVAKDSGSILFLGQINNPNQSK